jgi:hypothetical protein
MENMHGDTDFKWLKPCNNYPMQLLVRAKFLTKDENPKGKVKFL